MRFHIGFSKFIKPSKILYWLGLLFFGLLAFLGFSQQKVNAYVLNEFEYDVRRLTTTLKTTNYAVANEDPNLSFTTDPYLYGNTNYTSYFNAGSGGTSYNGYNYLPLTSRTTLSMNENYSTHLLTTCNYPNRTDLCNVFTQYTLGVTNTNLCSNYEDTKSISIKIPISLTTLDDINYYLSQQYSQGHNWTDKGFNTITNQNDILSFYIQPVREGIGDSLIECELRINDVNPNQNHYDYGYLYCPLVNYASDIDSYNLVVRNRYYYTALENGDLSSIFPHDSNNNNLTFGVVSKFATKWTFECDNQKPISQHGVGHSSIIISSDSDGSNVTTNTKTDGLDYDFIHLAYPNTFSQFLQFPLYLANALVNNHDTCNPITIDFSSLTRRFGGSNYVLTLPCLSSTLQSIFSYEVITGVSMYNLIDMFIAFYLLYKLAMRIIMLINLAMSGQDLVGYLFSGSEGVDSTDPLVHNGEVAWKTKKFRRHY